jgi:hypothetical protein
VLVPQSAPAQVVHNIQGLVRRQGNPPRAVRTPSIYEVLQFPSTSPTPVVRRQTCHRRVISNTTEEDIGEGMDLDEEMNDGPSGLILSSGSFDVDMAEAGSVASSSGQGRNAPLVFSVDDEAHSALILTPGGRQSLSMSFSNLRGSSFRVASAVRTVS